MRVGSHLMLMISLGLHAGLAGGIVLTSFHASRQPALVSSGKKITEMVLLRSEETPGLPQPVSAQPSARPVAVQTTLPTALPSPADVPVKKEPASRAPSASLALEANPNQHIRPPQFEAVLCPVPAPHLNNREGVVFLLDVSGSMYEPYAGSTRLMFARKALCAQIRGLPDGTPFAVTVYAQTARNSGPLVAAGDETREAAVRFIMQDYDCGGGTDLPAGLASAQELHPGSVVLASDGDLNIKSWDLMAKAKEILGAPGQGPALSIVGVYPRPNSTAVELLRGLAEHQGGTYHAEQFESDASLLTAAANKSTIATP